MYFFDMCCLCLEHNNNIQSVLLQDDDGIAIEEKLKHFLSELINFKPDIPKNICAECLKCLNYVYKFRQKCIKNLICLREYMTNIAEKECNNFVPEVVQTQHQVTYVNHIKTEYLETKSQNLFNESQIQTNNVKEKVVVKTEHEDIDDIDMQCRLLSDEEHSENTLEILVKNEAGDDNKYKTKYNASLSALTCEENFRTYMSNNVEELNVDDGIIKEESDDNEIDLKHESLLPQHTQHTDIYLNDVLPNEVTYNADDTSTSTTDEESTKKPFKCSECPKKYTQKGTLARHKLNHSGERPYKCDVCGKAFIQKIILTHHRRTHTGEKPYKCEVCEKGFITGTQLRIHKRSHTGERPCKCEVCGKAFSHEAIRIKHMFTHTGERPYKCDVCEKAFTGTDNLKRHKRSHSGERPYKCDVCEKAFITLNKLRNHERIHTGEKPYQCELCPYKSNTGTNLKSHMRRRHKN